MDGLEIVQGITNHAQLLSESEEVSPEDDVDLGTKIDEDLKALNNYNYGGNTR